MSIQGEAGENMALEAVCAIVCEPCYERLKTEYNGDVAVPERPAGAPASAPAAAESPAAAAPAQWSKAWWAEQLLADWIARVMQEMPSAVSAVHPRLAAQIGVAQPDRPNGLFFAIGLVRSELGEPARYKTLEVHLALVRDMGGSIDKQPMGKLTFGAASLFARPQVTARRIAEALSGALRAHPVLGTLL